VKNNLEPKIQSQTLTDRAAVLSPADLQSASVPSLIAQQAKAAPTAIAVGSGSQTLTYSELESRSNQLAHFFGSLGVGREQVVGLYLDRTPAMVIAALAILKAGGAYLPLQPHSPRERLEFMLRDAGVQVVITRSELAAHLSANGYRVVAIDRDAAEIARQNSEPLSGSIREKRKK